MRKKKDNKSQQSGGQQSPLALLAATCSKLEETGESAGGKNANVQLKTIGGTINSSQVINASDLSQYMQLAAGQTVSIVNADGTITQISGPQMSTGGSSAAMKPVTSIASQSQITQLAQAGQLSSGGVYSIIPAQQVQSVQIDGQEALYIPASTFGATGQQTFQIAGTNQIFTQPAATSQPAQTVVRTSTGTGQSTSTTQQTAVLQGVQGLNNMTQLTQLAGGQTVALTRPGNVMQTLQLPANSLQQAIQVQVPIQTQNGQMLYQTMQLPIAALSGLTGGQQVVQMPQQIQMAQIQLPASTGTGKDGSIGGQATGQSQVNSGATQATNQNVIAINLPNGQIGQLISAPQSVWPANALNLSNLTG